jgi:uncharacterized protein (DUF58 family)
VARTGPTTQPQSSQKEASLKALRTSLKQLERNRRKPWKRFWRMTREGRAFFAVSIGVGLAAINTGNNLLFLVFGFMMSLIVLSGVMSEIVLRSLKFERSLPERAFAGQPCLIELKVHNGKRRMPSYSLELEDLVEGEPAERRCYFLKVAPARHEVSSYRRTPARRGRLRMRGLRVATRYPFGIIEKWRLFEAPAELIVFPALVQTEPPPLERSALLADAPANQRGRGTEISGLRAYEMGEDARAIHWRRSAALGRLVMQERQRDASNHLSIVLDNARPADAGASWETGFEIAVSRAAALAVMALNRGGGVEVLCRGGRSPLVAAGASPDPVLRFLALLEPVEAEQAQPLSPPAHQANVLDVRVVPIGRAA